MAEHAALGSHFDNRTDFDAVAVGLGRQGSTVSEAEALGFLGRVPTTLHGGGYSLAQNGLVEHRLYGRYTATNVLAIPVEESAITRAIEAIDAVRMSVGFEGKGEDRSLVTHFHWAR